MAAPFFSVIIPTFNRPALLAGALAGLDAQQFRGFETIVVNDAGGDVAPVIRPFHESGRLEIAYLPLGENGGPGRARNRGIERARGEHLVFLDDDDALDPRHLLNLHRALAGVSFPPAVVYVDTLFETTGTDGIVRVRAQGDDFDPIRLLQDNYIPIHSATCRKECAVAAGMFEETRGFDVEDWDFWCKVAEQHAFTRIPDLTARCREDAAVRRRTDNAAQVAGFKEVVRHRHQQRMARRQRFWTAARRFRREGVVEPWVTAEMRGHLASVGRAGMVALVGYGANHAAWMFAAALREIGRPIAGVFDDRPRYLDCPAGGFWIRPTEEIPDGVGTLVISSSESFPDHWRRAVALRGRENVVDPFGLARDWRLS
ncbi:MAG: glycosyltransferase [Planctomycetes bacterium]|nr:glycosyltransferase [Planctomycetota bacterium]